ncbi:unnamed protein product [Vitrella brassicaformis CCMP3155]|uniref:Uncharacterized protein n=1 Tax=Vitrella brassicaformis (strain CCMP3155) TaxID=1169540 RepID=A0A0G4F8G9_VITBC|nr:unnamed protein product [Vitrella brassicaformis CCMP3155]|eukprot:CEM08999.1 unnamed protein product [Vitrella brassicaformis CCMP3155]
MTSDDMDDASAEEDSDEGDGDNDDADSGDDGDGGDESDHLDVDSKHGSGGEMHQPRRRMAALTTHTPIIIIPTVASCPVASTHRIAVCA